MPERSASRRRGRISKARPAISTPRADGGHPPTTLQSNLPKVPCDFRSLEETLQVEGGTKEWTLYDPTLLVSHVLSSCPALAEIYRAKLAEEPATAATPWHTGIGDDKHVPGDKLNVKNMRKSMVASFNFLELGEELLARDCTWFIPVVRRSS